MGRLDGQATALLFAIEEERQNLGIERINSVMFLKALLEMENSPIYDEIFSQIEPYAYPEMLNECYTIMTDHLEDLKVEESTDTQKDDIKEEKQEEPDVKQAKLEAIVEGNGEKPVYPTIIYRRLDGILGEFVFEEDMRDVIRLIDGAEREIGIKEFTAAFIYIMPKPVLKVLRTFGVNIQYLKDSVIGKQHNHDETSVDIPDELKSFLSNLNDKLKGEECNISCRDKECELVWQTLQKQSKRNVILIGEPGVGKTSIVEKITFDILSGNCPDEFKNAQVLSLDVNSSIAGTMYRGQSEERYAKLTAFLEVTPNVILFIDEIHLIRGAGACRDGEADLANAIKPILAGSKVRVIGATTSEEYEKYFSKDGAIKRRFRPIEVKEPKASEVYPMLKKTIESLSKYHGISISKEMVDFIILYSSCFNYETKNPDRTKDLIDLSMVVAKQSGKKEVDKLSVWSNFKDYFEIYSKMPRELRKSTAYHEAGHCVMTKCSKYLKGIKIIAVTIIPTDTTLGRNIFDSEVVQIFDGSMEYFVDEIAMYLAGRVAETLFTNDLSSGASGDLEYATNIAYQIVSRFGMATYGQNRIFFDKVNSQKVQDNVNKEIDTIIQKGFEKAKQVINDNRDKLEKLVKMLLNKGIVGEEDLAKIFNEEEQEKQELAYT